MAIINNNKENREVEVDLAALWEDPEEGGNIKILDIIQIIIEIIILIILIFKK